LPKRHDHIDHLTEHLVESDHRVVPKSHGLLRSLQMAGWLPSGEEPDLMTNNSASEKCIPWPPPR
jgi:hypothetical protein